MGRVGSSFSLGYVVAISTRLRASVARTLPAEQGIFSKICSAICRAAASPECTSASNHDPGKILANKLLEHENTQFG